MNSGTVLRGAMPIVQDKSKRAKKPYNPQSYDSPWIIKLSQYGNRSSCKTRQKCEGQEPTISKHIDVRGRLLIVELKFVYLLIVKVGVIPISHRNTSKLYLIARNFPYWTRLQGSYTETTYIACTVLESKALRR